MLRTAAIELHIGVRTGVEEAQRVVTTPRLEIEDEWDRDFEGLEAGDAIERRIRIRGTQILGMLLPPLRFEASPGIAVYADKPRILDRVNRGQYSGERSQKITYVLQAWGIDSLRWLLVHWLAVALLIGSAFVVWRKAPLASKRIAKRVDQALTRRRDSEFFAYKALTRSLQRDDPDQIATCYWRWREHLAWPALDSPADVASQEPKPSNTPFSDDSMPLWRHFEATRYGNAGNASERSDASALRRELRELRARWRGQLAEADRCKKAAEFAPRQLNPHT